jgi:hypothetical protein
MFFVRTVSSFPLMLASKPSVITTVFPCRIQTGLVTLSESSRQAPHVQELTGKKKASSANLEILTAFKRINQQRLADYFKRNSVRIRSITPPDTLPPFTKFTRRLPAYSANTGVVAMRGPPGRTCSSGKT